MHALAAAVADARGPWWLMGGSAVALNGAETPVGDIDLVMGEADAAGVLTRAGLALEPGPPSDRFRSALFGRLPGVGGLAIELMAGLEVNGPSGWTPVRPATRLALQVGGATLFAPDRDELAAILGLFGRPKDLLRAALRDQASPRSAGPKA